MKNFEGYLKRKFGDSYVLLAGGGEKQLSNFAFRNTWNDLLNNTNEFTFASPQYSGEIFLNYRTASGSTDGAITQYSMCDGAGGYAKVKSNGFVLNGGDDTSVLLAGGGSKALIDFSTSGHNHDHIISLGNKNASDLSSTYPNGLSSHGIYSEGWPFSYGCGITCVDNQNGAFQIAGLWNPSVTGSSDYDYPTEMYIRGRRDSYDVWQTWTRVLTNRNWSSVITLPTVNNGNLYLQASGTTKITFSANQSGNSAFNIATGSTNGTISIGETDVAVKGLGSAAYLANTDFVRAYGTSNANIDDDWGLSVKTFDPIPSGTPPEQNPNITLLSLGNAWGRRKMLAFTYSNDNIYYRRRRTDPSIATADELTPWVKILHTGNTSISNGIITINGTSITPVTSVSGTFYGSSWVNGGTVSGSFNMSTGDQINMIGEDWDGFAINYYAHSSKTDGLSIRIYNGKLVEIARWTKTGYLGLGTSSPALRLHVSGNTRIDFTSGYGTYYYGPTGESSIEFFCNSTSKAVFGATSTYAFMYNRARSSYLAYNDNGTLTFENQTVWHSGNDGHTNDGSGLDADLLDGKHASLFSLTSHDHSYITSSGIVTAISGTSRYSSGLQFGRIYNSGYPFNYGSTITMEDGGFGAELIFNGIGGNGATGSGEMRFRTHSDWGTSEWGGWRTVLDSSNYTDYTVTKTGSGASGSWGISVTGDAHSVDGYHSTGLWRSDGATWNPGANVSLSATANSLEWSFDMTRNGYTGTRWHVWDSSRSSMLIVTPDDGKVSAPYGFVGALTGNADTATSLTATKYIFGNSFNGTLDVSGNFTMSTGDLMNFQDPNNDGVAFNYNNGGKSTNSSIRIYNGKYGEWARFDTSGRFGIGTNSPSQKLHVSGNTRVDFTSGYGTYYYGPANESSIEFFNNSTRKAVFGSYSDCAFIWNANRANTLRYNDNGTLTFEGNTVWHAGNDGSGSGLDADLLDGLDSSYFLTYKDQITGTAPTFSQEDQGVKYYSHYTGNPLGSFRAIIVGKSNSGSTGLEFNAYWCVNPTDSANLNNIYYRVKRDAASDWGPYTKLILSDGNLTISGSLTCTSFVKSGTTDNYLLAGAGDAINRNNLGLSTTATSVTSLDVTYNLISVTIGAAGPFNLGISAAMSAGQCLTAIVYNSTGSTVQINVPQSFPSSTEVVSLDGSQLNCPAHKYLEISILCHLANKYVVSSKGQ